MLFLDPNRRRYHLPEGREVTWRISAYGLIVHKKKILNVVPVWNNLFELPGGAVEEGENIKEGIIRECFEETGYKVAVEDEMPFYVSEANFYSKSNDTFHHSIILVYKATLLSERQNKKVINSFGEMEIDKVVWNDINELNKKNTHPIVFPAIEKFKEISYKPNIFEFFRSVVQPVKQD